MDPLTPTTSTLAPAIAHIAETASGLAGSLKDSEGEEKGLENRNTEESKNVRKKQQDTVRWVLATPRRLQRLLDDEKREEANNDWVEVRGLLEKWEGVKGVEELKNQCLKIMEKEGSDDFS